MNPPFRLLPALACIFAWLLAFAPAFAVPTPVRDWTSSTGTKISGRALENRNGVIVIETSDKRTLNVDLAKFAAADQTFLRQHFGIAAPGEIPPAATLLPDSSITQPKGKTQGPVQAGPGSSYFYYLPKSLPAGRKHPLMMVLDPGGGGPGTLDRYIPGAERNGWILIVSVESKNALPSDQAEPSIKKAIEHAQSTWSTDPQRLFIGGFSGGSSRSFGLAADIKAAGVLGCGMGGNYSDVKIGKDMPIYILSGSNCWNRTGPGDTIARFCPKSKDSLARYFTGNHDWAGAALMEDGMTHLHAAVLANHRKEYDKEAYDNEAAILRWANELKAKDPARALMWTSFLKARPADSKLTQALSKLDRELALNREAVRWNEGLQAIHDHAVNKLGKEELAALTRGWANSQKDLQALATSYADTPWSETLNRMLQPAVTPPGR